MDNHLRHLLRKWVAEPAAELAIKITNAVIRAEGVDNAPPAYLAIGIRYEDGVTFSRLTHSRDPKVIYQELYQAFEYRHVDEILLVENGADCPDVLHHW